MAESEKIMSIAGIDVGTSGCKIVVYDTNGNVLSSAKRTYPEMGDHGYREISPDIVLQMVKEIIREVTSNCIDKIEALAVASLGESIVCLDQNDRCLCNSMVTGDRRGIEECQKLVLSISKEEIMDITGLPASEMYSLPKLIWMNENTDVFIRSKYVLFYEDYIGYVLTGVRKVSYSSASRSMAFDIREKAWSEKLLSTTGIKVQQMSEPVPSGTIVGKVTKEAAAELGLSEDTLVVSGGHDQNCAALGGGVISGHQSEDGHGTCELMLMMLKRPDRTQYMIDKDLVCVPYILPDTYLTYIEITTCGILMNWSRDTIFSGIRNACQDMQINFFEYMDQKVSDIPTSLLVLPQFGSSGNPNVDYDAKGLIWGLTIHTKLEEIYQAIKESMAYQMLMAYEDLLPLGVDADSICITGGGASSEYTLQLRADVFNKKVVILKNKEAGTLGAAITAGTAIGKFITFEEGVHSTVKFAGTYLPNPQKHSLYMEQYKKYKKLYQLVYNFK